MSNGESNQLAARERLTARLVLLVLVSCCVNALVVSWVAMQSSQRALRDALEQHLGPRVALLSHLQQGLVESAMAEARGLLDACGDPSGRPSAERLSQALAETRLLAGASCAAPPGPAQLRAGDAPEPPSAQESARPGLVWRRLAGGTSQLVAVVPGAPGFALAAAVDLARLRRPLDDSVEPGAQLLLLDDRGLPAGASPHAGAQPLAPGPPGSVGEQRDADGRRWLTAAAPLGPAGGQLLLRLPFDASFAPLQSVGRRLLALNAAAVALLSLLAWRTTRAIVEPIERLCQAARRVADGALDVEISEAASDDEIGVLTRMFNEMMRRLRRDQQEIQRIHDSLLASNRELRQANEVLSQLSITDGLTRLHNHRFFQDHLTREIKRVSRSGEPMSMLLIDIDDFKGLNDRMGHAAGDEVLVRVSRILETRVRDSDLLARYGGEEFVVLCSGTDRDGAYQLAESIRTQVAESVFELDASLRPARVTVSIGVARFEGNRKLFFGNADRALYAAKAQGKNCVVTDQDL